jgi:two-component system cell cycle sensor histidine kinase/response regulator CckA
MSELLTALMGLILKGSITYDYIVTGGVVSLIVAGIVIFLLKVMMRVRLDNEVLRAQIDKHLETTEGLSKALDFHSLLMEAVPDLLHVLNPAGVVVKWNKRAEGAAGYSHGEIEGRHVLTFIAEEDRHEAREGLEEAYLKGTATRELRLLTKDGDKVVHLFRIASIHDNSDRFIGFIAIARDISNLKKMEEEASRARKLESVRVLAGGIARDFNYFTSSILENIRLAVMNADQREILRGTLGKAEDAAIRSKNLARRLLAISPGGLPVKKPVALGSTIRVYAVQAASGSSSKCDFKISTDLWSTEADELQIGQVISSLVRNSVEAMPGGGTIKIAADNVEVFSGELPSLAGGNYVRISVADSGAGIPEFQLQNIFDPFFTTKQDGRGLGLTNAYAIIRNHEGHIRVESEPGKETIFYFYLPAIREGSKSESKIAHISFLL